MLPSPTESVGPFLRRGKSAEGGLGWIHPKHANLFLFLKPVLNSGFGNKKICIRAKALLYSVRVSPA